MKRKKTKTCSLFRGAIYRLLDANFNRAMEGLRVIEDTFRFIYKKDEFFHKTRKIRHSLGKIVKAIYPELILSRDTYKDSGRSIEEGRRKNIKSILIANFQRIKQALRVLEEYSRLISETAGTKLKKIRFKIYKLEKEYFS